MAKVYKSTLNMYIRHSEDITVSVITLGHHSFTTFKTCTRFSILVKTVTQFLS